jgi:hypothetical protein
MSAAETEVIDFSDVWKEIAETVVNAGTVYFKLRDSREARFAAIGDGQPPLFRVALSFGTCMCYPSEEEESFKDRADLLQMVKRTVKLKSPAPGIETHTITMLVEEDLSPLSADALYWEILGSSQLLSLRLPCCEKGRERACLRGSGKICSN